MLGNYWCKKRYPSRKLRSMFNGLVKKTDSAEQGLDSCLPSSVGTCKCIEVNQAAGQWPDIIYMYVYSGLKNTYWTCFAVGQHFLIAVKNIFKIGDHIVANTDVRIALFYTCPFLHCFFNNLRKLNEFTAF